MVEGVDHKTKNSYKSKKALQLKDFKVNTEKVEDDGKQYMRELKKVPKVFVQNDDGSIIKINSVCVGPQVTFNNNKEVNDKDKHDKSFKRMFY